MKKIIPKIIGFYFNAMSYISPRVTAKQGIDLFCKPFAKKLKPHQKEYLIGARNSILDHDDLKIRCYQWGNGSKHVLLIHGWASHSYRWKAYIQNFLKRDYTVHAFDAPAHGLSSGKQLNVMLFSEVIGRYVRENPCIQYIAGHSIGGYATLYWCYNHPEKSGIKVSILAAPGEVQDFFEMYKNSLNLNKRSVEIISKAFIEFAKHPPEYFSAPRFAKTIRNPALIIHDKQDKDTDYNYSIRLHEQWNGSELLLTEGLGHSLKSANIENKIMDFFAS
jgi:pimeloyl-ACP methyl ester carboxylesterase